VSVLELRVTARTVSEDVESVLEKGSLRGASVETKGAKEKT